VPADHLRVGLRHQSRRTEVVGVEPVRAGL
jgi:hypothetical protein